MDLAAKIYVAGHRGMVGSAIVRAMRAAGHTAIVTRTSAELDLRDGTATRAFLAAEAPAYVIMAAARVGGIKYNSIAPYDFLYDNLMMSANVIEGARLAGVRKLLFLGSSCIYPKLAPQPIREDSLLSGPLETTNEAYAVAKSPGSNSARMRGRNTDAISLARCPAIFTASATISPWSTPTSCRR
jgi:GDP-L-fucose synthase